MGFGEKLSKARLFSWRPVQGCIETLPLLIVQDEPCLVHEGLFSLLASGAEDKVGNVEAPPLGRDLDECLFASGSAKLKSPCKLLIPHVGQDGILGWHPAADWQSALVVAGFLPLETFPSGIDCRSCERVFATAHKG
jgi:hypothetical protein